MATENEIRALAIDLMDQHHIATWTFGFDHARRRAGATHWGRREITLSRHFVAANTVQRIRMTILHEIAHVLAGRDHHHDRVWQRICRQIGGDGVARYSTADTVMPEAAWTGTCPCYDGWKRHRLTRAARQGVCTSCHQHITWVRRALETS